MPRRPRGSGGTVVRADGRVFALLPPDLDPKRRPVYGPAKGRGWADRAEAVAWLDAEVGRRRAPPATATADELLGNYLARWYRLHEDEWPERTRRAYRAHILKWQALSRVRIGALTRELVQQAEAELRRTTWRRTRRDGTPTGEARAYSRRTIQQARGVLQQALEDLIPDVLAHNPARWRRRGRGQPEPEQPVWSAEQADRFLAVAERTEPRVALAFRLVLRRALRTGEAVALKVHDIKPAESVLTIDETAGTRQGTVGPTKTRRTRDVPLSADLLARLAEHRRVYPATDPHLFTLDGRPVTLDRFRLLWNHVVRVAQLPPITPKDARATCATLLLDQGWPLPTVSQLLGHTNIGTTSRFYQRLIRKRQDQTAALGEQLDAALDGASSGASGGEQRA